MRRDEHRLLWFLSMVTLGLGCGQAPNAFPSEAGAALVGGSVDTGHPAVGALYSRQSGLPQFFCTGTLIGPRTVLTASHCLIPDQEMFSQIEFRLDGVGTFPQQTLYALQPTPNYRDTKNHAFDAAIVILRDAPPVTPLPLADVPPLPGQAVTMVGYGCTQPGTLTDAVKRSGTSKVSALETLLEGGRLEVAGGPSGLCAGDSGGPLLVSVNGVETVVGVASGADFNDPTNASFARVDSVSSWIRSVSPDVAPVVQRFPDVPPTKHYFDAIQEVGALGISVGCWSGSYCPLAPIQRGEAAVMLVRAMNLAHPDPSRGLLGGTADNFTTSAVPYFSDVPTYHPYFRHIQKLYELHATEGCSQDPATQLRSFCPYAPLVRGEMAAFATRTLRGPTFNYYPPSSSIFSDVPPTSPNLPFVNRSQNDDIWCGVSSNFGVQDVVLRDEAAAWVTRGILTTFPGCSSAWNPIGPFAPIPEDPRHTVYFEAVSSGRFSVSSTNGSATVSARVGDPIAYRWVTDASTMPYVGGVFTVDKADTCGHVPGKTYTWFPVAYAGSGTGSQQGTVAACQVGVSYIITVFAWSWDFAPIAETSLTFSMQ